MIVMCTEIYNQSNYNLLAVIHLTSWNINHSPAMVVVTCRPVLRITSTVIIIWVVLYIIKNYFCINNFNTVKVCMKALCIT